MRWARTPEGATATELAAALGEPAALVDAAARRLADAGLVERPRCDVLLSWHLISPFGDRPHREI
jgi:DNA-binding transcriptional ArsR family regulator